jgi:hypothetical protein
MIAKDEANDRLIPTLQGAALHITGYMFCDTGSTDGTPKLAKSIFDYFHLKGKIAHHTWKDFSHNRNLCLEDGQRLMGDVCDYWLLLDADQIMVSEQGGSLSNLILKDSAYFLREVARDSEFTNRRIISTKFPWRYKGKVHEVILPIDDTWAAKETTGGIPKDIYSLHESDMTRGFDRDAVLLESSVAEDPTDTRSTFYLANTYNMMNRKEDAIIWWAKRSAMGGWEEEMYMSAFWIASVFDVYLRGKSIGPETWNALVAANLVPERPDRDPEERINVTPQELISVCNAAHKFVPSRQEALYMIAKFSRQDLSDFENCSHYAALARSKPWITDTTLFANINMYRYGVLDELCVCSFYSPSHQVEGQQACKTLIEVLESEGVSETSGRADLRNMLKVTRGNLNAHKILAAEVAARKDKAEESSNQIGDGGGGGGGAHASDDDDEDYA